MNLGPEAHSANLQTVVKFRFTHNSQNSLFDQLFFFSHSKAGVGVVSNSVMLSRAKFTLARLVSKPQPKSYVGKRKVRRGEGVDDGFKSARKSGKEKESRKRGTNSLVLRLELFSHG